MKFCGLIYLDFKMIWGSAFADSLDPGFVYLIILFWKIEMKK